MENKFSSRLNLLFRILILFVFSVGLISYFMIGTTSRYIQDDYCYAYYLRGENFWQEQIESYYQERPYSGNRYSLSLGIGLSELTGRTGISLLPGFVLVSWVFGTYLLIKNLPFSQKEPPISRLEILIISSAVVLFTLSLTQDWVQSYFWRPGMFPYLAPLVIGTYLFFLILKSRQIGKFRWLLLMCVFLFAIIAGGFSEIGTAVMLTLIIILLIISSIFKKKEFIPPLVIALLGGLLAMVLLIIAPMNIERLNSQAYDNAFNFPSTFMQSLEGSFFFYQATAYRMTLMYLSVFFFFLLLSLLFAHHRNIEKTQWIKIITFFSLVVVISFILTFASMVPTFLIEASYPKHRALIIPRYISILLAMFICFGFGKYVFLRLPVQIQRISLIILGVLIILTNFFWVTGMTQFFLPPPYPDILEYAQSHLFLSVTVILAAALLMTSIVTKVRRLDVITLLIVLYLFQPAIMAARIIIEYPILRERSNLWDIRDAQIIKSRENGSSNVTVRAFDSFVELTELSDNPDIWVNRCAALYYGVNSIRAIEPVLDPVRFENP